MLVLSRKPDESIVISDDNGFGQVMKVTVLSVCGNRVKLGFDIADDVAVHRLEVWEQLQGSVQSDRSIPAQNAEPFARTEARRGKNPMSLALKR